MYKKIIFIFILFLFTISSISQTTKKEPIYTKDNLVGVFITKEKVKLNLKKGGDFTWDETNGSWSVFKEKGVFIVNFEDDYGNEIKGTIVFINKDKFTLITEEYGKEIYTRK